MALMRQRAVPRTFHFQTLVRAGRALGASACLALALWSGAAAAAWAPADSVASTEELSEQSVPNPESAAQLGLACLTYLSVGRAQEALKACDGAVQLNPDDAGMLRLRGGIRLLLSDPQAARVDFELAIARDPFNVQGYELAGKAAFALGDYVGATQSYDAALLVAPRDANAFDGRGASRQALRHYGAAEQDFSRSIAIAPDQPWTWNARCWVRVLADSAPRAALSDCRHAAALAPNEPHIRDSLGWVWLRLDDPARARRSFDLALSKNARLASSLCGRGFAEKELGDARRAAIDAASAEALEPGIVARFRSYGFNPTAPERPAASFASAS